MTKHLCLLVLVGLMSVLLLGARGCQVSADTDKEAYEVASTGVTTIYNQTAETVYLPGCSLFSLEKLEGREWIDRGPHVTCIWEGNGVPLEPYESISTEFIIPSEMGTWRLHYVVSKDCEEGVPLSEANCADTDDVYTPPFEVIPQADPTCTDLGGIDFGMCEMILGWALVNGECAMVSGCATDGFAFYESELDCLSSCADDCDDWGAAYAREAARIGSCEDASECEAVPGTSCGCTRNLVANKNADTTYLFTLLDAMNDAGCGLVTTCDCPLADGYVCEEGLCGWNYL